MDVITNSDVLQALVNITAELKVIWPILMKLTSFVGLIFIASSIFLAVNPQYTMMMRSALSSLPNKMSLIFFCIGVLLLRLPAFLYHVSDSVFNNSSLTVLSYQALSTGVTKDGAIGIYLDFFITVVMIVGLISVLKGLIGYAIQGGNAQALAATVMHIGVGAICVNISLFMQHIGASLGGVYQSNIDKFF